MDEIPQPRDGALTFLKWLVIALTATMLAGLVTLIVLFVTRFPPAVPPLPETIALPEGEVPFAFTRGATWIAIVTRDDEILIFDETGETLRQRITIE
ncbi:DUF6476 family protein [Palleronia sp. LCG004]|uniref:DUF6476 family protein n=1 Tax=Palleronia sp. LCG004 TaxID=3079304 RepID=UPI0029420B0E|nr:DUF6476 family protein [Palleronia sp. LCG004]WOI57074.1 DUF6476 family protein [Palleronia sp. LCG004]